MFGHVGHRAVLVVGLVGGWKWKVVVSAIVFDIFASSQLGVVVDVIDVFGCVVVLFSF